MIKRNKKSNLLEKDPYRYKIQDVDQANLHREIYSYTEVPKIHFNHRHVPIGMPKDIWITDTTFRDGQQSRVPYTVKQIVDLYKMMNRLGGSNGIIRQTEFFIYSEKDREAVRQCMDLGYEFPEITTWIRATEEDFKLAKDMGIKETGILVSCSDYHIFNKLGKNRREAMEDYILVIKKALEIGIHPRCHLEDITRADYYGFVVPFVNELMSLSKEANIPIKIRACDTMGYGVSLPGTTLPRSIPGIIYGLQHYSEVPSELLEWHGHNDFYKAVINATTAWLYGCSAVNCSLLGIGERTGNVPLEAMVFEYAALRGGFDGMDPTVITEIAEYYEKEIGYIIPEKTPFVGKDFNSTRAGIHADGLLKDEEIYNIFDTKLLLNRSPAVSVSNTSGLAGISYWINSYYNISPDKIIKKDNPLVKYIKKWVDNEYSSCRTTSISDEELVAIIEKYKSDILKEKK